VRQLDELEARHATAPATTEQVPDRAIAPEHA
jgi:hypothetical protein